MGHSATEAQYRRSAILIMSDSSLDWYLTSIGRVPLLTADEEIILGHQVQEWMALKESLSKKGQYEQPSLLDTTEAFDYSKLDEFQQKRIHRKGKRAFDRMYAANLRLVVAVAKKYSSRPMNLEFMDLIQDGNLGLARAVEKFDPKLGYKFSTYAYWWIRQGITRGIIENDLLIRMPIHAYERLSKIRQFSRAYSQEHGKGPSTSLICKEFKLKPQDLDRLNIIAAGCISLHSTTNSTRLGSDTSLLDIIPTIMDDEPEFDPVDKERVEKATPTLKKQMGDKEAQVFERSFFTQPHDSRAQIARDLGMSSERARQLLNRSVQRYKALFELQDAATG